MFTDLDVERFWGKVAIGAPEECWEWQGYRRPKGRNLKSPRAENYGVLRRHPKTDYYCHRLALAFATESMPEGMFALHSCDNPPCCNPHHLRWGTNTDNQQDAIARKRDAGATRENREKTHCKRGHLLSGENLVFRRGGKARACLRCERYHWRKRRALKRGEPVLPA